MAMEPKMRRGVLWFVPLALVPIAFLAAIPWFKTISEPIVLLITAATAIFVMSYSSYLSFRAQRGLDEVQRAGAAFAAQWGAPVGQVAFALLLILTPFGDFATGIASRLAGDPGMAVSSTFVTVALSVGFCTVVLLQAVGTVVVQAIWWTVKR